MPLTRGLMATDGDSLLPLLVIFAGLIVFNLLFFGGTYLFLRRSGRKNDERWSKFRRDMRSKPQQDEQANSPFDKDGNLRFSNMDEEEAERWRDKYSGDESHDGEDSHDSEDSHEDDDTADEAWRESLPDDESWRGEDSANHEKDEHWDTGNPFVNREPNQFAALTLETLFATAIEHLTVQPFYMGIDLKEETVAVFEDMVERLQGATLLPILQACAHANLAAQLSLKGAHTGALEHITRALRIVDDNNVCAETTLAQATIACADGFTRVSIPGVKLSNGVFSFFGRSKHPIVKANFHDSLIRSRDAARICLLAPKAVERYRDASEAAKRRDWQEAVGLCESVVDELEEKLRTSDCRWPLAAAYYDLALCKINAGAYAISALSDIASAKQVADSSDSPWEGFRQKIDIAAEKLLRQDNQ